MNHHTDKNLLGILRKPAIALLALLLALPLVAGPNEEKILLVSVNDMHASFDRLPKLKHLVDSLKNLCPNVLVLSAGITARAIRSTTNTLSLPCP